MLPKKNRLTKKTDFDKVFKEGTAVKGNFLFIKYRKNNFFPASRIAFIIPLKAAGNAVTRNKIKRILSETLRHRVNNLKTSYDIVVAVKNKESSDVLKSELISLINKARIINEQSSN